MTLLILVDPACGIPVYRQLMDQIKLHVASGVLAPGRELPSTRALSAELGINPMTISKAYGLLERDGVVERRPGRPVVVRDVPAPEQEARRAERLEAALAPAATIARQLQFEPREALEIFERLLAADDSETPPEEAP